MDIPESETIKELYPQTVIDLMFKKAGVTISRNPKELREEIRNLLQSLAREAPLADEEELAYSEWLHGFLDWLAKVGAKDKNMHARVLNIVSPEDFPETPDVVPPMNAASNKWIEQFEDWVSKINNRKDHLHERIKIFLTHRPSDAHVSKFQRHFKNVDPIEVDVTRRWLEASIIRVLRAANVLAEARAHATKRPRIKEQVGITLIDLERIVQGLEAVRP